MIELALLLIGIGSVLQWGVTAIFLVGIMRERKRQKEVMEKIHEKFSNIAAEAATMADEQKRQAVPVMMPFPFGKSERN